MNKKIAFFLALIISFASLHIQAQTGNSQNYKTYKVGIFAPLYLDSVFNDEGYRYGKNFPKFTLQGLDFVQGAQVALDSMKLFNGNIDATFFDSKSLEKPIATLISSTVLDKYDLLIGSVKDVEYTQLANFAKQKNIPFISSTYPNDGGVTSNPFLVIVNSTLKAHCEAIYSYLLQSHGTEKIYLLRKPGTQEDKVAEYFKAINSQDGKNLLNIQTINITDGNFAVIKSKLDSTKQNIIIGGSLNEDFALKLATQCSSMYKSMKTTLIGMPNWDGFAFMSSKSAVKDYPVYFTTPYYNGKYDSQSKMLQAVYRKNYKVVPSDMAYKGFETVYLFAHLLTRFPDDYMGHLNDYPYKVFNEYLFKPVFLTKESSVPDYFENKRLYFMKGLNGSISKAW